MCLWCVQVYVCVYVILFLMAGSFTYNELSYLTISSIQNKAKNLLKVNKGDHLEVQIEVIKAHSYISWFKYRKKKVIDLQLEYYYFYFSII